MHKVGAGREMFLQNAFHAELLGSLERPGMAASVGIAHIILETDASTVKTALEGDRLPPVPVWGSDHRNKVANGI